VPFYGSPVQCKALECIQLTDIRDGPEHNELQSKTGYGVVWDGPARPFSIATARRDRSLSITILPPLNRRKL
jgi:hypothetical protein